MIKDIINEITEKYWNESEEYYSEYRYDSEENEFNMKKELEQALTEKGVNYIIKKEDGFSSCGYDNDFLAIAYIDENGSLALETVLLEGMENGEPMKLSDELKHCLDGSGCGNCEHHEADTKFICRGLLQKAYERIKGYEELEEQDRLLKLPTLIGGTVWDNDFGQPCSYTVTGFSIGKIDYDEENDIDGLQMYYRNWNGSIRCSCVVSEIGKTVFLTREQAESALQEMNEMEGKEQNGKTD